MGVVRLPRTVETITLAHDGDDPDTKSAAAQAYHRGVVRYLGQGLAAEDDSAADRLRSE